MKVFRPALSKQEIVPQWKLDAEKVLDNTPGAVVWMLPGQPLARSGKIVNVYLLDDERKIWFYLVLASRVAGLEFNSFRSPQDEVWINIVHFRTLSELYGFINDPANQNAVEYALFDIKLKGDPLGNGLDGIVNTRKRYPNALLALHSTIANATVESPDSFAYRAANIAISKDVSPLQTARFLYQLVAFTPAVPICSMCPAFGVPEGDDIYGRGRCKITGGVGIKYVRYHAFANCHWVLGPVFNRFYAQMRAKGKTSKYFDEYLRELIDQSPSVAEVRHELARLTAEKQKCTNSHREVTFVNNSPVSIEQADAKPLDIRTLVAAGLTPDVIRDVTPPTSIQELYAVADLEKERHERFEKQRAELLRKQ